MTGEDPHQMCVRLLGLHFGTVIRVWRLARLSPKGGRTGKAHWNRVLFKENRHVGSESAKLSIQPIYYFYMDHNNQWSGNKQQWFLKRGKTGHVNALAYQWCNKLSLFSMVNHDCAIKPMAIKAKLLTMLNLGVRHTEFIGAYFWVNVHRISLASHVGHGNRQWP